MTKLSKPRKKVQSNLSNTGRIKMRSLRYEIGPIRPPSEAYSLLVRFTRNCPWNKCEFCFLYKGSKFERRTVLAIKEDIDTIKAIHEEIIASSWHKGGAGKLSRDMIQSIFSDPRYDEFYRSVAAWMYSGGRHVFIQDANSLVMKVDDLVEAIEYLRQTFPTVDRITSYGRSQTIAQLFSVDDLRRLKEAGLTRLHLGMESGSDFLLGYMRKGVTKEQHVIAGLRVKEAGIELSEYVILGLGGKTWWREHALETADCLNQINPDFIRMRTFSLSNKMLLYKKVESGDFIRQSDEEILVEEKLLVEQLEGITSNIKSDHVLNLLEEVEGKLPEDKKKILSVIDRYFELSPERRLAYRLGRKSGIYRSTDDLQDEATYMRIKRTIQEIEEREPGSVERQLWLMADQLV
jgi:hypothetical protein